MQKIPDEALQIFVCDGSPRPDPFVAESLAIYDNVRYLHAGRQLSFGETYNLGIQAAETPMWSCWPTMSSSPPSRSGGW